jgi:hypothetical protein
VRPSPGAATGFIQATEHFPTAGPSDFAAAGTPINREQAAALRQRRNSTSEFGLSACPKNRAGCSPFRWLFRWQILEHEPPVQLAATDVSRLCFHWNFHFLRFCLDPQPSTPRSRFIGVNSQPSSHQVPKVIIDVPTLGRCNSINHGR